MVNQGFALFGLSAHIDNSNGKLTSMLQKRFNNSSVLEQHSHLFKCIFESVRKTLKFNYVTTGILTTLKILIKENLKTIVKCIYRTEGHSVK